MKKSLLFALLFIALTVPSFAGTKEQLIQLQTQMQDLQDQMHRMQQSFDERMGVMRNLIEQTTDAVNKTNTNVANLDKSLHAQSGDAGTKVEQVSGQVQALQDSVDELKARMAKLSKQLEDMQAGQQNLNAQPGTAPGATGPSGQPQSQAPPPEVLYNNALRDYNANKLDLAAGEFQDYLKFYPTTDLAGNAQFYLADIQYRGQNYQAAVTEFDKVLEQYPGGNKTATAQLRKGESLLQLGQRDPAIKEFRSVVARYPRSPEATIAADRLRKLGVSATAAKPSAATRRR
ncbi:MAG TPA: tetratricopeptide repeat protein [Terriglobales bacterium]|nr:tetratricopeptide repeat protein [Terriglobales bacterium]